MQVYKYFFIFFIFILTNVSNASYLDYNGFNVYTGPNTWQLNLDEGDGLIQVQDIGNGFRKVKAGFKVNTVKGHISDPVWNNGNNGKYFYLMLDNILITPSGYFNGGSFKYIISDIFINPNITTVDDFYNTLTSTGNNKEFTGILNTYFTTGTINLNGNNASMYGSFVPGSDVYKFDSDYVPQPVGNYDVSFDLNNILSNPNDPNINGLNTYLSDLRAERYWGPKYTYNNPNSGGNGQGGNGNNNPPPSVPLPMSIILFGSSIMLGLGLQRKEN